MPTNQVRKSSKIGMTLDSSAASSDLAAGLCNGSSEGTERRRLISTTLDHRGETPRLWGSGATWGGGEERGASVGFGGGGRA